MAKKDKEVEMKEFRKEEENVADVAKAKRRAAHEAKLTKENAEDSREEFRKFFAKLKTKLDLSPSLESVIWLHFKAYNFDKKDNFSAGLKHFGIGE